jgi:hypothetical protein
MPGDFTAMAHAQARAEHDERQLRVTLAGMRAEGKPDPDTVMTTTRAELLIQVHDYEDGEQIGVTEVGDDRGLGHQRLVHKHGLVLAEAGWVPVFKGSHARLRRRPQRSWTAQRSSRQLHVWEKS